MDTRDTDLKFKAERQAALTKLRQEVGLDAKPATGWLTCKALGQLTNTTARNALLIVNEWQAKGLVKIARFKVAGAHFSRLTPHYAFHPKVAGIYGLPVVKGLWGNTGKPAAKR